MNNPPTALVGFKRRQFGIQEKAICGRDCRLSMNNPPTALVGFKRKRIGLFVAAAAGCVKNPPTVLVEAHRVKVSQMIAPIYKHATPGGVGDLEQPRVSELTSVSPSKRVRLPSKRVSLPRTSSELIDGGLTPMTPCWVWNRRSSEPMIVSDKAPR